MAESSSEQISIRCPECDRRLKIPLKLAGKRLPCPACKATIQLPSNPTPPTGTPAAPSIDLDSDLDDIGFKLADELPKAKSVSSFAAEHLDLDPQELAGKEYTYPCKVCGTTMYAKPTDIGSMARCPDCYAEYSVPSPAVRKAKQTEPDLDKIGNIDLKPPPSTAARTKEFGRTSAEEYLAKAAKEVDSDDQDLREAVYDFDTSGWMKRTFAFLGDPSLLVIAVTSGLFMGGILVGSTMAGSMMPNASPSARIFGVMLVLILLGGPLLIITLANGIAVLEASANRLRRIGNWPIYNPTDALGEIAVVVGAFLLSALPGGLLAWLGSKFGVSPDLGFGMILLCTYLLFPIVLLGMLDNQSVGEPYSSSVVGSISSKFDAWGAMYLLTGLAMGLIFILYLVSASGAEASKFVFGMLLPVVIFFIFHQIGVLGSRIADVTNLAFESDESDEPEAAEDAKTE